jgi:hypothetical protein
MQVPILNCYKDDADIKSFDKNLTQAKRQRSLHQYEETRYRGMYHEPRVFGQF